MFFLLASKFALDTTYSHFFTQYQRYDIVQAPLLDHLPTLEFSHRRARLYNLCNDPSEQNDLAKALPDQLLALYSDLITELSQQNPMQFSCDADDLANSNACGAWLAADEVVPEERILLYWKVKYSQIQKMEWIIVVAAFFTVCGIGGCFYCCSCCLCKKQQNRKQKFE